jgi:hypothetical protein
MTRLLAERIRNSNVTNPKLIFSLALGLFFACRLWHFTSYDLWGDEIFSLEIAQQDWRGLFSGVAKDVVHPPLFYILLKVWLIIGGDSLIWMKIFPLLTAFATVIPFLRLARELNLRQAEINFAIFLMGVNGYLIYYAQEIRMYSLLLLFSLCSLWLFVRLANSEAEAGKSLVALLVVNLLLAYTHYFGLLVIGVEFTFLLIWKRQKLYRLMVALVLPIICLSPWVYIVIGKAKEKGGLQSNAAWIPRPRLNNLLMFYRELNGDLIFRDSIYVCLFLFGAPILIWIACLVKNRQEDQQRLRALKYLLMFCGLPVLVTCCASYILPYSVWVDRYLIIVAVPYMLLLAIAVFQLRPYWVRISAMLLILGWVSFSEIADLRASTIAWEGTAMGSRIPWEHLMRQLDSVEQPETDISIYAINNKFDRIKVGYDTIVLPMEKYYSTVTHRPVKLVYARDLYQLNNLTLADARNHFWITFFDDEKKTMNKRLADDTRFDIGEGFEIIGAHGRSLLLLPVRRRDMAFPASSATHQDPYESLQ